jgi:tRNA threonylcarbamoyladenosine biosynthesis protein TsaE
MTDSLTLALPDPDATDALGMRLARTRPPRAVVHLEGELGAGKSSLARALLRALGVTGPVRSPTYTLVERYPLADGEALHLDLYRITDPDELEFLALDALADDAVLWLVEWPQRGGTGLPPFDLRLRLAVTGEGRRCDVEAGSPVGRDWLARLAKICPDSIIS